jgi:diaminopimelate decarboxylase
LLEPGRAIVGNAGVLLTQVLYLKHNQHRNFAIVDAAMNDLMRPALYDAWQEIVPLIPRQNQPTQIYDVVGPVCETGDFLGKDRELSLQQGDYLAIRSAGAYGFSMSSNYNTRPRAAEVLIDGDRAVIVRPRETLEQLMQGETTLD